MTERPSVCIGVQTGENEGKKPLLNYKSAAYPDSFHTYRGFEFRVTYYVGDNENGETEFFLTLDPHTVLVMKASVGDLIRDSAF